MQKKQTPPVDLTIRKLAPTKIHSFEVDIKSHAPLRPRNIRDVDQSRRDTPVQHAAVAGFPPRGEPPSFPSSNSPPPLSLSAATSRHRFQNRRWLPLPPPRLLAELRET